MLLSSLIVCHKDNLTKQLSWIPQSIIIATSKKEKLGLLEKKQ
jgi:hypothetical protein